MIYLRKALPNDAESLGKLYYEYCKDMYKGFVDDDSFDELSVEQCIDRFKEIKCRDTIVGLFDDEIVSFCSFGPCNDKAAIANCGEVYQLYVKSDYRLKGDGRRLLHEALRILGREEYNFVVVKCLSNQDNTISFYENMGFRDTEDEYPLVSNPDIKIKVYFKTI